MDEDSGTDSDEPPIRCARCQTLKPPTSFNWRRKALGQRDTYCRPCRADYKHEHYVRNRQRYIDQAAQRKKIVVQKRMRFLLGFYREHPCVDCGESDPRVLEFDHVRGAKAFNVSQGFRDRPWASVLEEIAKCEVRCCNCHRRRTASSLGFHRALLSDEYGATVLGLGQLSTDPLAPPGLDFDDGASSRQAQAGDGN